MDFQDILSHADSNIAETKYTGGFKRYSTVLPPPKKVPKSNVQSDNVKKFLERKKAEEEARAAEAQRQKEKLLALRAQSSKNNKKAKIMASRTKDNDFSRIKLTDDEMEAKKKREALLIRKNLADTVERMKARIEMEEREKLLPKKRKRKSKNGEPTECLEEYPDELQNRHKELNNNASTSDSNMPRKDVIRKPKPPPPAMSFSDLLRVAEKKQFEPLDVIVQRREEEKLMTKKERKLREEEIAREKRKRDRLLKGENSKLLKPSSSSVNQNTAEKGESKNPVVIRVGSDISRSGQDITKFKIPKEPALIKNNPVKQLNTKCNSDSYASVKSEKSSLVNGQKKLGKVKDKGPLLKDTEIRQKGTVPKPNGMKTNRIQAPSSKAPKLDEAALKASLEKEIREKLEKEFEEKIAAKIAAQFQNLQPKPSANENVPELKKQDQPVVKNNTVKKPMVKPVINSKKDLERMMAVKKQILEQQNLKPKPKPKLPEKKAFHMNPYLEPPRRLLEPQRPPRLPLKRKIESDDDEDDDDDDMRDFIDDSPSQNEENYSEYIKEIFKYDKNKYMDDDDDEVIESSFADQMKEEVRSAKLGYLEDLEEERLEMQRRKKKKLKK